jgi:hypothetical protein
MEVNQGEAKYIQIMIQTGDLQLQGNSFSGDLPVSISSLTSLRRLTLEENKFEGSIPPDWGALANLEALVLVSYILHLFIFSMFVAHVCTHKRVIKCSIKSSGSQWSRGAYSNYLRTNEET